MDNLSKTFGKLTIPLLLLLAISFFALPAEAKYGGGTGEPNDPYLIFDANQMNAIGADSNDWDKHFKLMADIDLSGFTGTTFNIIGYRVSSDDYNPFTGVFDGNGHIISNFTYTSTGTDYVGLFGCVGGVIKDLGLIDPNVDAGTGNYVGALVGIGGTITGCYVEGGSVSGDDYVGGLAGGIGSLAVTVTDCYATCSVLGNEDVGGLVGFNNGSIYKCYSAGSVTGTRHVGGLAGLNMAGFVGAASIFNCYSRGSVSGNSCVGGLVGYNLQSAVIHECYSSGSVTGTTNVGGLVGCNDNVAPDSFWDTQTSGQTWSDGGTGLPTAEMQTQSTFTDAGWDFESVWWILEGAGYPRLCWEEKYGAGSGHPNDPYLIYTAEQMNTIGACQRDWDKHFILMANIDLSGFTGTTFNIIGYRVSSDDYNPFTGVFDGNGHIISNFTYTSTGTDYVGLFGYVIRGEIKDMGLIDPNLDAGTGEHVGSMIGHLRQGTITNCYVEGGSVSGHRRIGGLWGKSWDSTITNCYSTGSVAGNEYVGGMVGGNSYGSITNCYSSGDVSGGSYVGGLAGGNFGNISDCYATGSVSGDDTVGGLVGNNGNLIFEGRITNCYSAGSVTGTTNVGGLVGFNLVMVSTSFWDIETSRQPSSDGGTGKTTAEMQTMSTFTDAGWDFTTPIWTIDEGVDYPRLWWETSPVLHAEPEITLGPSNTISWDPIPGANDYYAECAADANFTSIIYNTGWITETSYEFTDLELGKRYWYSVKARNSAGVETDWSNVESSLQVTLADAVDMMLDPDTLKNKNMKSALLNKINTVQQMLDKGRYEEALNKLQNDILQKTDGCAETGQPDKNDWIITCEEQEQIYPLIIETIENVKGLMQ